MGIDPLFHFLLRLYLTRCTAQIGSYLCFDLPAGETDLSLVSVAVPWCAWVLLGALVVSVATLVMVAAFALWRGRWFCNHVCLVGACLRLTSRKAPLLKIRIDAAKCVGCGICERGCKAGAIDAKAKTVDNGLCVRCFDCLGACGKGAVGL